MGKKKMGFAAMDSDKVRSISSKGGKKAHEIGKAHTWTKETAAIAGSKGGKATTAKKRLLKAATQGIKAGATTKAAPKGKKAAAPKMHEVSCSSPSGCAGMVADNTNSQEAPTGEKSSCSGAGSCS